ncbi:MAG: type IV secretion system DNA-binding domain-containing protein [Terracidiphilus sp.]|nr:type IV secretion system DNA-binding domain-containing protein [Terracidiphilus sp.]
MAEWGRKQYAKPWPSRAHVWTWGAFFLSGLFFAGILTLEYEGSWTAAERLYLSDYLKSGARGKASATAQSKYTLLEAVVGKGQRLVIGDEIEPVPGPDGRPGYRLTEEGVKDGISRLMWVPGVFNDRGLHRVMSEAVYADHESWDFYKKPVYLTLAFFMLGLFVAVPKDRARRMVWKHGRRLRGPELVTTAEFNAKLGHSKGLMSYLPDGVTFINEERTWADKLFRKNASRWARIPREREAMHFLIVGDSGTGKSAAIRQMLAQIWERGEAAIVYDPAMEYLPQFYRESRGDVILNPLDARCPFWTPGDEVPHEAEALTLAASLFPDQGRENRFFVEAPRKIFAHLLNLKPTPEQLTYWMSNAEEIDKRVEGTELQAMIDRHAANQRSGVLGSLNMVADAFKLLPREAEAKRRWSTVQWAAERKGWVFLTSKPTMRERMRPLMSLWLDLLVLRLMNDGEMAGRKTWFVLDELASLQRLPQLMTAVTENRKSNNPMVLGFQGKAQVEALYGHVAEAMLSQPATKIFLKTSEPYASEWISKAIGEVEIERFRESRTVGRFPRNSESEQREITREPLVMASEVGGLDPLHGYMKHGNLVLRMRFPYIELQSNAEKFIERKVTPQAATPARAPQPVTAHGGGPGNGSSGQPAPQPKPPKAVQKKHEQEQQPAAVNEQHPFFE